MTSVLAPPTPYMMNETHPLTLASFLVRITRPSLQPDQRDFEQLALRLPLPPHTHKQCRSETRRPV